MERIKIKDAMYGIESIQPVTPHIMRIVFKGDIPVTWGDITTYTTGGFEGGKITGYETIWKQEGQTVYLSNNGSVYVPPKPYVPPEPHVPTLEEVRMAKRQEISTTCEYTIYAGIEVTLADGGVEHYSLTIEDQLNLFGKQAQLAAGAEQLEYHADGQPCRYYTAADMQSIIQSAMWHVSYHTTYCNAINMWIAGCQTTDEVSAIFYGADVPEEYKSDVLKAYLVEIASMAAEGSSDDTQIT